MRQVTAERGAVFLHVFVFRRIFGEFQVGEFVDLVIGYRQQETVAETLDLFAVHLLLLVRDVHRFTGTAHAVALDGLGQDQGGGALVFDG